MRALIEKNMQTILNHYLALDPESTYRLTALENKIVTVEFLSTNVIIQLCFFDKQVIIKSSDFLNANTIIKGTPLSLLRMSLSKKNRKSFFEKEIVIEGDIECGQQVIHLFDSLEIDWEEYLSGWIGDIPAHQTGLFFHSIKKMKKKIWSTLRQNTNEYLHEEKNICPSPEEIHDFYNDIDTLRMDTDRLEAKINQLLQDAKEV